MKCPHLRLHEKNSYSVCIKMRNASSLSAVTWSTFSCWNMFFNSAVTLVCQVFRRNFQRIPSLFFFFFNLKNVAENTFTTRHMKMLNISLPGRSCTFNNWTQIFLLEWTSVKNSSHLQFQYKPSRLHINSINPQWCFSCSSYAYIHNEHTKAARVVACLSDHTTFHSSATSRWAW